MERFSSFPSKRPSVFELERKTRTPSRKPAVPAELIRHFHDGREGLIRDSLSGIITGQSSSRNYANLMDRFIRALFRIGQIQSDAFALLALGGYGRRELCFGSDVDLLLVYQGRLPYELEGKFGQILYPLWDAKLEVGHAVLTVQDCIRLALDHFTSFTSFLDARFLAGSYPFIDSSERPSGPVSQGKGIIC